MAEISPQQFLDQLGGGTSFERADLSGIQLEGAVLPKVNLARADLTGANLAGADLRGAVLTSASLREAYLQGALLEGARLRNADLEGANLNQADLLGCDASRANFEGATLEGAKLRGTKLVNAVFTDANLGKAELAHAALRNADCTDAYLGGADLSNVDGRKLTLEGANLEEANLSEADLRDGDLTQATLDRTKLVGTKLHGATVTVEQLGRADVAWLDVSRDGDGSTREEGDAVGTFLHAGEAAADPGATVVPSATGAPPAAAPTPAAEPSTRYFGQGDVLRNAELEFGAGSTVHVDGRFERCRISLARDAALLVGPAGVVQDCTILGEGIVTVEGALLNDGGERSVTSRVFVVRASGQALTTIKQPADRTRFGFEPGCVLRLDITR